MWTLHPKAQRFLSKALSFHTGNPQAEADPTVPPELAPSYLEALRAYQKHLIQRIESGELSEDDESDLINDVYFFESIARSIETNRPSRTGGFDGFLGPNPSDIKVARRCPHWHGHANDNDGSATDRKRA